MDSVSDSKVEAVLDLARQLWDERDGTDVDRIDGAFYWRICRGDLLNRFEKRILEHRPSKTDSLVPPGEKHPFRETLDHLHSMEMEMPGFSRWIAQGELPRMRDPLDLSNNHWLPITVPVMMRSPTSLDDIRSQTFRTVSIGVRNSRWLGRDVEAAFREQLEGFSVSTRDKTTIPGENFDRIGVTFDFFGEAELRINTDWPDPRTGDKRYVNVLSPIIVCTSSFPLPPEGLITAAYDLIPRQQHQWHERLFGNGQKHKQRATVAIRTWAIGLLLGFGARQRDAMMKVAQALGPEGEVSDQWNVDRRNLVSRVPEATPYVFKRKR